MSNNQNAKYTFFYLLSLVALFFMAFFTGGIWFQIINKHIPDILNYSESFSSEFFNFAIAAVLVATPVYFLAMKWINKGLKSGELNFYSGLRKWLIYLIIFATSVTSIGWLIGVINVYLDGGMTSKFILKAITALVISLGVLSYYIYDIRRQNFDKDNKTNLIYAIVALFVVVVTLAFGFVTADGPAKSRMIKHDNQVVNRLQSLKYEIEAYYYDNESLPKNLDQLKSSFDENVSVDYNIIEDRKYELCAEFEMNRSEISGDRFKYLEKDFDFEAGYDCFELKVNEREPNPRLID